MNTPKYVCNKHASAFQLEAWAGIEPAYKGFADPRLTTWLPGPKIRAIDILTSP